MGFNFPNTPTEGAVYIAPNGKQYVYTGGVWKASAAVGVAKTVAAISDTPPASPVHGQLWWESDTGNLFVYYDDGDSQQWVQANLTASVDYLNSVSQDMWAGFKTGATFAVNDKADGTGTNAFTVTDAGNVNVTGSITATSIIQTTTGYVVAGTDAPGNNRTRLTSGQIQSYSNQTYGFFVGDQTATNYVSLGVGLINSTGQNLNFQIAGTTRMTLDTAGRLSVSSNAAGYAITANCITPGSGLIGFGANTSYYGINGFYSSPNYYAYYGAGPGVTSGGWTTSDARFKRIGAEISGDQALANVLAVPVMAFTPAGRQAVVMTGATHENEQLFGFIAQQVEKVIPAAVRDISPPAHDLAVRAFLKGVKKPQEETPEARALEIDEGISFKAINDRFLIATLWAAMQTLDARVKELEGTLIP